MTTADDHRRAGRLMVHACDQALALIDERQHTARNVAMRSYVFVEEAARLWPKRYSDAEAARVLAAFERTWTRLETG